MHHITLKNDHYYIGDKPLLISYPEGDYDIASPDMKKPWTSLYSAVYDYSQYTDGVEDGDLFFLDGQAIYSMNSYHLQPIGAMADLIRGERS